MKNRFFIIGLLFASFLGLASCEDSDQIEVLTRTIPLEGTQEVPAITTTGTGTVEYSYNKTSRILSYKVTWSNLADSLTGMHIHGLATRGQNAGVVQNFTLSTVQRRKEGTFTGTLFVDNVGFKESDLLANKYYLNVHSKTYPGGEIRGQLEF